MNDMSEIIIYTTQDGLTKVDFKYEGFSDTEIKQLEDYMKDNVT